MLGDGRNVKRDTTLGGERQRAHTEGWKVWAQRKSMTDWSVRGLTWGWGGQGVSPLRPQEVGRITQSLEWRMDKFEPYSVGQLGAKKGCFIQTNQP